MPRLGGEDVVQIDRHGRIPELDLRSSVCLQRLTAYVVLEHPPQCVVLRDELSGRQRAHLPVQRDPLVREDVGEQVLLDRLERRHDRVVRDVVEEGLHRRVVG